MSGWGAAVAAVVNYGTGREANRQRAYDREVYERFAGRQLELAEEQWKTYKEQILPLEMEAQQQGISARELALKRGDKDLQLYLDFYAPAQEQMVQMARDGIDPQYDRVTRDASSDVDNAFARQKEVSARDNQRLGIRPDSGRGRGADRTMDIEQASTRSFAVNRAREAERDRVETVGFNRLASATGRQPIAANPSQQNMVPGITANTAGNSFGRAGAAFGTLLNDSTASANAANQATGYWAGQAYSAFKGGGNANYKGANGYGNYNGPMADENYGSSYSANGPPTRDSYESQNSWQNYQGDYYADGGLVRGAPGRDNVPASVNGQQGAAHLSDGEYVIPADVVKQKGVEFFTRMVEKYHDGGAPKEKQGLKRGNG